MRSAFNAEAAFLKIRGTSIYGRRGDRRNLPVQDAITAGGWAVSFSHSYKSCLSDQDAQSGWCDDPYNAALTDSR